MFENIIKKAIEGGWNADDSMKNSWGTDTQYPMIVCDPLFWQSLGKACGWPKQIVISEKTNDWWDEEERKIRTGSIITREDSWKYYALKFHEINLIKGWESAISYLMTLIPQ